MKKASMISLAGALCLMLSLTSCSGRTEVRNGDSYIYSLNTDRTGLVKITYDIPRDDAEAAVESVLEELKKPAEEIEYSTVIPEGVEVIGYNLKGTILDVDFDSGYRRIDQLEEKLVRAAVVQSLLQVDGVNGVIFTVEGEALQDREGNNIGLMNGDDFVENTGSSPSSYQTDTLTLYFANESGDRLVEQKTVVRYSSNISKEKLIVEKLVQGPQEMGGYPVINPDVNLLSVTIKDRICYVNFDSTFLTNVYDVLPEVTVYSIVDSLAVGTDAYAVQITINGESNSEYMGAVDLSQPLEGNMDWVADEDGE